MINEAKMCAPEERAENGSVTNSKWVLKERPQGIFDPNKDVELKTESISTSSLDLADDEIVVESSMLSGDAFIRTMMDEEAYHGALSLGDTIPAIGYGKVVAAGPKACHKVGTVVSGTARRRTPE